MLAPGWNGVGADISAHTDPGLIGGLATRMQKNQVRRATGAPDFVLGIAVPSLMVHSVVPSMRAAKAALEKS